MTTKGNRINKYCYPSEHSAEVILTTPVLVYKLAQITFMIVGMFATY